MQRPAVRDPDGELSFADVVTDRLGYRNRVPRGGLGVVPPGTARTTAAALALDGWARRVDLGAPSPAQPLGGDEVDPSFPARGDSVTAATAWRLYSSGTTGRPKAVDHTLASLTRTVSANPSGPRRWGLLYESTRMAGVQVLLQARHSGADLLDATGLPSLQDRIDWLAGEGVDGLSATPTLWRQILQGRDPGVLPLRQVTLGGEIADQGLLDALTALYPGARVTHVFAATETGAAFAVSDRRAGFPRAWLAAAPRGIRLAVQDGELAVGAPVVGAADDAGMVRTGDLVEVTEDRVLFAGRTSGLVNVGGVLVSPERVETVLRTHPSVRDAVVMAKRNPFSGQILVAQVVVASAAGADTRPSELRRHVDAVLGSAHVPATVSLVDAVTTSKNGKAVRQA